MLLKHSNSNGIFLSIILLEIIAHCNQSIEGCFLNQWCFTPRNFSGRYERNDLYDRYSNETKSLCGGVCHYNSTYQLRCCAYEAEVITERITEKVCRYNHVIPQFILFGELAKANEFPFMAALGWRVKNENTVNSTIVYKCGGTIYDRGYVVTAAHCLYHSEDLPVVVRPGGYALDDTEAWDLEIAEVIEHPDYEYPFAYNDIAIIRLKKKFYGNPNNDVPACIWTNASSEDNVTAIGYGDTQFGGKSSALLMKTDLVTISNQECQLYYEPDSDHLSNGIVENQICASDPEQLRDTCHGDSGGPIIKFVPEGNLLPTAYIVGITSFGIGCGTGVPSVYTRISEYIDWIENVTYGTMPI